MSTIQKRSLHNLIFCVLQLVSISFYLVDKVGTPGSHSFQISILTYHLGSFSCFCWGYQSSGTVDYGKFSLDNGGALQGEGADSHLTRRQSTGGGSTIFILVFPQSQTDECLTTGRCLAGFTDFWRGIMLFRSTDVYMCVFTTEYAVATLFETKYLIRIFVLGDC